MKIAIVGGGWVGCHLANKLKKNHNVTLFERTETLFTETSFFNQNNRLGNISSYYLPVFSFGGNEFPPLEFS